MAQVLLFHHAQGLTDGVLAFADDLRAAGYRVTVPDLYDGRTYSNLDEGVAHADELGVETVIARGAAMAADLPPQLVYAGFSLGVLAAQSLAQRRAGAVGALLWTYPGDRHLFTDRSLPDHDDQAAQLVLQRSLAFLARVG